MSGIEDHASDHAGAAVDAERGRVLIEESRELVVVLEADGRVVAASRRARETIPDLVEGHQLPAGLLGAETDLVPQSVPYEVEGRSETLLYLATRGDLTAYEELRAGFTASVSHELRTPLARLLAILESADLPDTDLRHVTDQARLEVEQIRELIDDVLFLSELETGKELVALGSTPALDLVQEVVADAAASADRAGLSIRVSGDPSVKLPLRPRMIRVIVENLVQNAVRYAGPNATLVLRVTSEDEAIVVLEASDDGAGVAEHELPRLFERFYRSDQARASRGTGLGLAIVKHVVTSADGAIEASGAPDAGLRIRCIFPLS